MKKARIIWVLAAISALTLFSSCGNVEQVSVIESESSAEITSEKTEPETTEAAETTEINSAAETSAAEEQVNSETEPPAEISSEEPETENSMSGEENPGQEDEDITEYIDKAELLMNALNAIDNVGGGNIVFDETDVIKNSDGDRTYAKVSDTRFFSTSDIREFMEESLTQNMISQRYSSLVGGSDSRYIDVNGVLYGDIAARGCGFAWTDTAPVISDITDTSFTAVAEYDDYGAVSKLTINIVSDNGVWKIDSISYAE